MAEAPGLREQEDCPSAEVCGHQCDQHDCGHHPEWFDRRRCHHPAHSNGDPLFRGGDDS